MKKFMIIALTGLLFGGFMYYYTFHKGHTEVNISSKKSELQITAHDLLADFMHDEQKGNEKFTNKIIEVSGTLKNVKKTEEGYQAVITSTTDLDATVVCNFEKLGPGLLDTLSIGKSITVKGVCTGFLFDVVLDHAVLM